MYKYKDQIGYKIVFCETKYYKVSVSKTRENCFGIDNKNLYVELSYHRLKVLCIMNETIHSLVSPFLKNILT